MPFFLFHFCRLTYIFLFFALTPILTIFMAISPHTRIAIMAFLLKYQPSSPGGTRSPPATPHHLLNPKWPPGGPKMADGVWKGVYPWGFGHSKQLSLNKFFDLTTTSLLVGDHPRVSGRWGLERGVPLGFLVLPSTFAKNFDPSTPSMIKGCVRERE